jgi:uncharacterized membrane protein YdjX (TVP38/TMEM64 family)
MKYARLALAALVLAALVFFGRSAGAHFASFAAWVQEQGALGPAIFIAGYAVAVVAFVPGSLLTLAAGAIFGLGWGTLYVLIAATLGASLAFLVARYVARGAVEQRLANNPKLAAIDRAIGGEGRKIVLLLRLSPAFPFNVLNYALGLTRVRFGDYLIASLGMLPGTLLYVYSGKLAGDVPRWREARRRRGPGYWALLGWLVATLLVTLLSRARRRASQAPEPRRDRRPPRCACARILPLDAHNLRLLANFPPDWKNPSPPIATTSSCSAPARPG